MARNRTISPDFWTWEAVIDCTPMARLLFIGLWNFADDGGVQPLRPRTIRLQVFPGDAIGDDAVRAMIEALGAQGLVRVYSVEGQDYVAIVEWAQFQRVGKRARLRWPGFPSPRTGQGPRTAPREKVPSVGEADDGLAPAMANHCIAEAGDAAADTIANHCIVEPPGSPSSGLRPPSPRIRGEKENIAQPSPTDVWRAAIGARLREAWPDGPAIEAMEPADTGRWIGQWIAEDCDLERDVLAAVSAVRADVSRLGPPRGLYELALQVNVNRKHRLAARTVAEGVHHAAPA